MKKMIFVVFFLFFAIGDNNASAEMVENVIDPCATHDCLVAKLTNQTNGQYDYYLLVVDTNSSPCGETFEIHSDDEKPWQMHHAVDRGDGQGKWGIFIVLDGWISGMNTATLTLFIVYKTGTEGEMPEKYIVQPLACQTTTEHIDQESSLYFFPNYLGDGDDKFSRVGSRSYNPFGTNNGSDPDVPLWVIGTNGWVKP